MKKKVLLLMTSYYSIHEMIILNLEKMGYEVFYRDVKAFKYKGLKQKLNNFFRKSILGDKTYKDYLRKKCVEEDICTTFKNTEFDYTLVIRPDAYSPETIHFLKKISNKVIGYQWDGFSRFTTSPDLINTFDVFGTFDKNDYQKHVKKHNNLILTQNFYFDFMPIPPKDLDLFYIGAKEGNRLEVIQYLISILKDTEISYFFRLYSDKEIQEKSELITNEMLSYLDVLKKSSKAKIAIDIKHPAHNGLSLRFFEALYFNQKVITDNITVKEMDFYNSNNILVVEDFKNLTKEKLDEFLNKEYLEVPKEIKQKYSFESWFNTMIS